MSENHATEASLARDMAHEFHGGELPADTPAAAPGEPYNFEGEFQTKIAALSLRDTNFRMATEGLVRPEYFENQAEAALVNMVGRYWAKYKKTPDKVTLATLIRDDVSAKVIRKDIAAEVIHKAKELLGADIGDRDYVVEKVAQFARHQAMGQAIIDSISMRDAGRFDLIEKVMQKALNTGATPVAGAYDYYASIDARTDRRRDMLAGLIKPNGVTTGIKALDDRLMHKGWGRKELSMILGGAKAGKTTALINFGKSASLSQYNVIYFTCEVAAEIIAARADASLSGHIMNELERNFNDVHDKIKALEGKAGRFILHEYATGSLTCADVRRTLEYYRGIGLTYDLIITDYADIMAPEYRSTDAILNSKQVLEGLRSIAHDYDAAVLTATQTNRIGFSAAVAKAEHVAEDFNKVRIADIIISINKTEEEASRNEARLFFAASRNQAGGFSIRIQQDLERMRFIVKVLGIE